VEAVWHCCGLGMDKFDDIDGDGGLSCSQVRGEDGGWFGVIEI